MRTRRTKEQIRKDNYNKDVDAYNFYVVNLDTKKAETGFEFKSDAVDLLNDYDDKKKYKVVSKRALKSMGIENPNESFKYEGGGDFQSGVYAKGGSLESHGIEVGDTFLRTISGTIQKVKDKNGNIFYINLATGERDKQPPLPFAYGGGVKMNTEVILSENRPNGAEWQGVVKPFMLKSIEENQYAGGFKRYEIDIYDEVDREPTKEEIKKANEFFDKIGGRYAKGGQLIGNQKSIDLNKNGRIDAEDFKLLRTTMNGAWRKERKYVNSTSRKDGKVIDYEVNYARKFNPSRKGYKGKTNFADGGGIESAIKGYKEYTKKNWEGYDYFSEKYAVNELAELELNLRKLNDGRLAPSKIIGGGYKNAKKVAQDWLQSQIDKQKLAIKTNGLSNYTNHRNFRSYLVDAKRENIISESKFNELLDESNEIMDSLPKTFADGGDVKDKEVTYFLNKDGIKVRSMVEPKEKLSKREWAEKFNPRAYEFMTERKMATGGSLPSGSINALGDLWFAVQQKDTDDYKMLSQNLDKLNVPFAIQNEVSADAESQRGRKALNIAEVHDRIKKIVEKNNRKFATGGGVDSIVDKKADEFIKNLKDRGISATKRVSKNGIFIYGEKNQYGKYKYETYLSYSEVPNDDFLEMEMSEFLRLHKKMATGGGVSKFKMLSDKVAKNYEGKRVKPQYQKEYGKVYSKSEAKEVGDKVAGKVKAMQKMATGGENKKGGKGAIMILAKKIRKDGEKWTDAVKRAGQQLK